MRRVRENQKKRKRGRAKRNEPTREPVQMKKPGRVDRITNDGVNTMRDKGIFYNGFDDFNFEGENIEDETESDEDETEDGRKDSERG